MRAPAILMLVALCAACGPSAPPPAANAPAAPAKSEPSLNELLKRADAVIPKDAPDTLPAKPPDAPAPVVIVDGPRSPQRYSAPSSSGYTSPSYDAITPQKSDADRMMDRAEMAFSSRISNLSYRQSNVARLRAQKRVSCTGRMPARPVNGDFPASAASLSQDRADSPECRSATAQLEIEESLFKQQFDGMEIDAKRMGIYPGVMRDLYGRHGFSPY